ncbi:MAG: glycosyltransferase family 39 protein [Bacteroidetes bacterium]|nr:glycosyltransferase family 39 protein [Bacteroidota bacterium]
MKNIKLPKNPFLLFLPFLVPFVLYVIYYPTDGVSADQGRYMGFAHNLVNGFYSPPAPDIDLTNGPGYPLFLAPFVGMNFPLITLTLMNALFYYLSIVFLFKSLLFVVNDKFARFFSLFWALYYMGYQSIPFIHTETFTYLLVSLSIFTTLKAFDAEKGKQEWKYLVLSGLLIGYLALTKMIFGYVLFVLLLGYALIWLFRLKSVSSRKITLIISFSLITTLPYLFYTYHLTGRLYYWGMGNDALYWMSSPYHDEYGDWKKDLEMNPDIASNYNIQGSDSILKLHHQKDFELLKNLKGIERDDEFKRLAINNIKAYPLHYAENIVYNAGRLVFQYPFSHAVQRPKILLVFPINGILFTLILFCIFPTLFNWKKIPAPVRFLLLIVIIYLGGSLMVSTYARMFTIIVPVLLLWIAFILQHSISVHLKFGDRDD